MSVKPLRFIDEPIEAQYDQPSALEKKPGCPDRFVWRGASFRVVEKLSEWHDYRLRGKTLSFYVKERGSFRAKAAERQGTWGVGRDYFWVRTDTGQVFDLYFDRAPKAGEGRKGAWFLYRELSSSES